MRLQITELRRQRVEPVVWNGDGLAVLQFREHPRRKDVLVMRRVALARAQRLLGCDCAARQQRDMSTLTAFRQRVVRLQAVSTSAQLRGGLRRKLVTCGEE